MRHAVRRLARRLQCARAHTRDTGQISILIIGLFAITLLLVLGSIDVTAAQIARTRLLDAADAAALDAADAIDEPGAYGGLGSSVVVSSATVQAEAGRYIAGAPRPSGITSWRAASGTGSPDGREAVVVVQGDVALPFSGGLLAALGGSVTITVTGRARADLR